VKVFILVIQDKVGKSRGPFLLPTQETGVKTQNAGLDFILFELQEYMWSLVYQPLIIRQWMGAQGGCYNRPTPNIGTIGGF
jgi:hypothetical protein